MYIAFFDSDKSSTKAIRDRLIKYTVMKNTELDVLWFEDADAAKVSKYVSAIGIAFISLDCEAFSEIGFTITKSNPDCYICYYKATECDLLPLLHSRPYEFYLSVQDENEFFIQLDDIMNEYIKSKNVFYHETRRGFCCFPVRNILYMQSDMKYVLVATADGKTESIFAKLSDIEKELCEQGHRDCFVRVHKSYLVNAFHVSKLDKTNHTVLLSSGEEIPVSEACYKDALFRLKRFHATDNSDKQVISDVSDVKNAKIY